MTINQVANLHKVLNDKVRLSILDYIKSKNGVTTLDILSKFHIDASTLSFHIAKMEKVNLILKKKKGRFIVYKINKPILSQLHRYMYKGIELALSKYFSLNKPEDFNTDVLIKIYKLYSDPIRLKIVMTIAKNPGISGKELAIETKTTFANLSSHLKKLINNNIVITKKKYNSRRYWLDVGYVIAFHRAISLSKNEKI